MPLFGRQQGSLIQIWRISSKDVLLLFQITDSDVQNVHLLPKFQCYCLNMVVNI